MGRKTNCLKEHSMQHLEKYQNAPKVKQKNATKKKAMAAVLLKCITIWDLYNLLEQYLK